MTKLYVILPNQVMMKWEDTPSKNDIFYLIEHSEYFDKYKYHKLRLVFLRSVLQEYKKHLEKSGYKVKYFEDEKKCWNSIEEDIKKNKITTINIMDPVDIDVKEEYETLIKQWISIIDKKNIECDIYEFENENFITTTGDIDNYNNDKSIKKKYFQNNFYIWQRKRLDILIDKNGKPEGGKWNYDRENRDKVPDNIKIPHVKSEKLSPTIKEAIKYVSKKYSSNYGCADCFMYPTTRGQSLKWLNDFLKKRFYGFGPYEDATVRGEPFLFHSVLSMLLNVGLLKPDEVIEKALEFYKKQKNKDKDKDKDNDKDKDKNKDIQSVSLASVEGFIRQLIGWREYIRYMYVMEGSNQKKSNYLNARMSITTSFYTGETGLLPIDEIIKSVLKYAYCHHIQRLMYLGSVFMMIGIKPDDVYQWFMELFCDSYEWVMVPNVYAMSQFADGGIMMTRPYFSSSNYIMKMSNYSKSSKSSNINNNNNNNKWYEIWDAIYYSFINKHEKKLSKIYATAGSVHHWKKKSKDEQKKLLNISNKFIKSLKN